MTTTVRATRTILPNLGFRPTPSGTIGGVGSVISRSCTSVRPSGEEGKIPHVVVRTGADHSRANDPVNISPAGFVRADNDSIGGDLVDDELQPGGIGVSENRRLGRISGVLGRACWVCRWVGVGRGCRAR